MDPLELYEHVLFKIVKSLVFMAGIDLKNKKPTYLAYSCIIFNMICVFGIFYTITTYDYEIKLQSMGILCLAVQVCL